MTQVSTITQPNAAGAAVRTGFNAIIEAIASMNSGPTEPDDDSTRAFSWWYDTTANQIKLRNAADTDWVIVADVLTGPDRLQFYSNNALVLTSGVSTFSGVLTVDISAAVGEILLGSTLNSGSPSRFSMFGHDSGGNDTIYSTERVEITSATDGAETGGWVLAVRRAGTLTDKITVGDAVTIGGTLNATILEQAGVAIATLIAAAIATIDTSGTFSTARLLAQADSGKALRKTGTNVFNVTVPVLTQGSIIVIHHTGASGTITFVTSGTTLQNGVTLAAGKSCTLTWLTTTDVRILGENA